MILAIETSCDDTCAAVVTAGGEIRSNAIASQGLLHERYGGVVPEIASRHHLELIDAVTADALERAAASALAEERPTSSAPIRPGPRVTATVSTSSSVASARSSASAVTASISSR